MSHVTVESGVLSQLMAAQGMVEVRDQDGRVVGLFVPLQGGLDASAVRGLFDMDKARETLKRQYCQGRPLKEILSEREAAESQR